MKRNHRTPKGYRLLKLGELIKVGDKACMKEASKYITKSWINTISIGHHVAKSDGNAYYRKIEKEEETK